MLVAISIPIFSARLESSRQATDLANIRNAYAEVSAAYLTDNTNYQKEVELKHEKDWSTANGDIEIGKTKISAVTNKANGSTKVYAGVYMDPDGGGVANSAPPGYTVLSD